MDSFFEKLKSGGEKASVEKKPLEKKQVEKEVEKAKPEEKPSSAFTSAEATADKKATAVPSDLRRPKPTTVGEGRSSDSKEQRRESKERWFTPEGKLAIDVYQTDLDIVIQTPIAGVKKGDLDISIENDMVIIRGNREKPSEIEEKNYFYQECYWGPFSRQIILPVEGDPSRMKATMKDGILTLKIPRIERERKRKVEVK